MRKLSDGRHRSHTVLWLILPSFRSSRSGSHLVFLTMREKSKDQRRQLQVSVAVSTTNRLMTTAYCSGVVAKQSTNFRIEQYSRDSKVPSNTEGVVLCEKTQTGNTGSVPRLAPCLESTKRRSIIGLAGSNHRCSSAPTILPYPDLLIGKARLIRILHIARAVWLS